MTLGDLGQTIGKLKAEGKGRKETGPLRGRVPQEVRDPVRLRGLRLPRPRALAGQQEGGAVGRLRPLHRRHLHLLRDHPARRAGGRHRAHGPGARHVGGQHHPGRRWRCSCSGSTTARPPSTRSIPRTTRCCCRASGPRPARPPTRPPRAARPGARRVVVLRIPRIGVPGPGHPRPLHRPQLLRATSRWCSPPSGRCSCS